jgi:hypothetical protein
MIPDPFDINTAPQDGSDILIWTEVRSSVDGITKIIKPWIVYCERGRWYNNHYGEREVIWRFDPSEIKYWLPLPIHQLDSPPTNKQSQTELEKSINGLVTYHIPREGMAPDCFQLQSILLRIADRIEALENKK